MHQIKILVIGATGGTGKLLVQLALDKGYLVRAFVRDPNKLSITHKNLSIFQGSIANHKQLTTAMSNINVVISAVGNNTSHALFTKSTIISEGTNNIINSMKLNNISRLFFITSFGVNSRIFLPEKLFIRTVLKNIFADIPTQELLIKHSNLHWTIIRPVRLINSNQIGKYESGEDLSITPFSRIARIEVADFILKEIVQNNFIHKIVTIKEV